MWYSEERVQSRLFLSERINTSLQRTLSIQAPESAPDDGVGPREEASFCVRKGMGSRALGWIGMDCRIDCKRMKR